MLQYIMHDLPESRPTCQPAYLNSNVDSSGSVSPAQAEGWGHCSLREWEDQAGGAQGMLWLVL